MLRLTRGISCRDEAGGVTRGVGFSPGDDGRETGDGAVTCGCTGRDGLCGELYTGYVRVAVGASPWGLPMTTTGFGCGRVGRLPGDGDSTLLCPGVTGAGRFTVAGDVAVGCEKLTVGAVVLALGRAIRLPGTSRVGRLSARGVTVTGAAGAGVALISETTGEAAARTVSGRSCRTGREGLCDSRATGTNVSERADAAETGRSGSAAPMVERSRWGANCGRFTTNVRPSRSRRSWRTPGLRAGPASRKLTVLISVRASSRTRSRPMPRLITVLLSPVT